VVPTEAALARSPHTLSRSLPLFPRASSSSAFFSGVILGADNTSGRREIKLKSPQHFKDFTDKVRARARAQHTHWQPTQALPHSHSLTHSLTH
jgi:hypothetical protein